jgi:ubiquinone/menaquinone biosynthesis C-methylase UbiE/GNAT superfamily N-acetyltransferase
MRFRTARAHEGDRLAELQREASLAAFGHIFPRDRYPYPDAENRQTWTHTLETDGTEVLVADDDGWIVGVAVVEGPVVRSLFVAPTRWGNGIGRALLDEAIANIQADGYSHATLHVLTANERARTFYERLGWEPTGKTMLSSFPPQPELMEYRLNVRNRYPDSLMRRGARHPFIGSSVAARYSKARPDVHEAALELVAERFGTVEMAIDIGCGTGLSLKALTSVARTTIGTDASEDMIRHVDRSIGAALVVAEAEALPYPDSSFDLATVASAIHWFEPRALDEIHRVLYPAGRLFVYDVWFPAEMAGEPTFGDWLHDASTSRYPSVPKNSLPDMEAIGLVREWEQELRRTVLMRSEELVDYLMTHSERIAAVQRGQETETEQQAFLLEGVEPFFADQRERVLTFGIRAAMYRAN